MKITGIIKSVVENNSSAFFYTPQIYKSGKSILFKKPVETITAKNKNEFIEQLNLINDFIEKGLTGYGTIDYEAGYLLEEKLNKLFKESKNDIMTFHFFEQDQIKYFTANEIKYNHVQEELLNKNYSINNFKLNLKKDSYKTNINKIREYIKEGDTYQVNYTLKGKFSFEGNVDSLFLNLIFNQSARYSAFINSNNNFIISISPELFFDLKENKITACPMKGTIKRGSNLHDDKNQIEELFKSKKDRAENVMIVDLLRNDLGKISEFNSVKVTSPFDIEKYESLYQMTSTVEGYLRTNNFSDIIKSIFPCGSITGAPKIRTMEIINELEKEPRGVYTGTIGIIEKDNYKFNVPIRTIQISKEGKGEIGLGSGVVWDSNPEAEYNETLLKSNFLTQPEEYFELFESVLIENRKPFLLEEHLNRLKNAAEYFLFNYNFKDIHESITKAAEKLEPDKKYKMKITLDKWGSTNIYNSEINAGNDKVKVAVSNKRIDSKNKYQYFKTTNRKMYDEELKKYKNKGFYEVIFLNEKGDIAEGSFTNIFIKKDNSWFTPQIESGILNGIYRDYLLKNKILYKEKSLSLNDLKNADKAMLVNSVRGEVIVNEIYLSGNSKFIFE